MAVHQVAGAPQSGAVAWDPLVLLNAEGVVVSTGQLDEASCFLAACCSRLMRHRSR